ncbi:MAG: glycosyltransferase [Methanosarcina sp.]|jgi:glycosyltransferase involved in cell wall biosynthesis|nr:glycosyltransferase [Methanosarcina sp.]MDD3872716.1 glycosyltransferase [Methanosarcina sp.]MDD4522374.1 glycosyltransferase [Methanosarcina sp.]HHV24035.1 glycosyltransferase family 4 protein [Methanosarcina sp.]
MRILLLANQPEHTTRLKMFQNTLEELGYETLIPKFNTRNWIQISALAKQFIKKEKPDVVHLFNVPDIIYYDLPKLKGTYYKKMIYDYRSPWGIEFGMTFGSPGRIMAEYFEKKMAASADLITTVNWPLGEKVKKYTKGGKQEVYEIPNYPRNSFLTGEDFAEDGTITFLGRVCEQEGIGNFLNLAKKHPNEKFRIVGDGPFSKWYLAKKLPNVEFLGWQPHEKVAGIVKKARICMIPRKENALTPYSTDKSIWKLNEYLNLGKLVIASGITKEENRKNLLIVKSSELENAILEYLDKKPEKLNSEDYRFWESNTEKIKNAYEKIQ